MSSLRLPFHASGLAFACIGCGCCCRNHGAYTYVYLSRRDAAALAAFFGLPLAAYEARDLVRDEAGALAVRDAGERCLYLDDANRCRVYAARPMQCRTWPFWPENLNARTWSGPVAACCPGVGVGRVHSREEIDGIAARQYAWYHDEPEG